MTCMDCLSRFSCSGALVKMYQEEAEKCPYLKNKADFVEVVRCKDCKHFTKKGEEFLNNDVFGVCEKSRTGFYDEGEEVYGNDFCSCGERVNYGSSKAESK